MISPETFICWRKGIQTLKCLFYSLWFKCNVSGEERKESRRRYLEATSLLQQENEKSSNVKLQEVASGSSRLNWKSERLQLLETPDIATEPASFNCLFCNPQSLSVFFSVKYVTTSGTHVYAKQCNPVFFWSVTVRILAEEISELGRQCVSILQICLQHLTLTELVEKFQIIELVVTP
jgi:hypothetical protein